ncbi:MAG: transposase [Planctomycetaceae bacterium]
MARHRLTDKQWALIEDVFPEPATTGRPPRDPRELFDGILWILRTGSPWRDLPEEFGPWKTAYNHFDQWNGDGTLDEIKKGCWLISSPKERLTRNCGALTAPCFERLAVQGAAEKGIPRNRKITL